MDILNKGMTEITLPLDARILTDNQEMKCRFSDSMPIEGGKSELENNVNILESSFVAGICGPDVVLIGSKNFTSTPCLKKKCTTFKLLDSSECMNDSGFDDGSLSPEQPSPDCVPADRPFQDFTEDDQDEGFSDVSSASDASPSQVGSRLSDALSNNLDSSTSEEITSEQENHTSLVVSEVLQHPELVESASVEAISDHDKDLSCMMDAKLSLNDLNPASVMFAQSAEFSLARKTLTVREYNERLLAVLRSFAPANLDCLIGRKMGLDHVDIVAELFLRNVIGVLATLLNYLSDEDLFSMMAVTRKWKSVIKCIAFNRSKKLRCKRPEQIATKTDENLYAQRTTNHLHSSSVAFQPLNINPFKEPTVDSKLTTSDQILDKTQLFWLEASKLRNHESLRKCPRCQHPSRLDSLQERAWCQNANCSFDFCVKCLSAFHGLKHCASSHSRALHREIKISGRQSRQNLRRL